MATNFWTWSLSEMLGQPEGAVRLFLAQVSAYPILCVHRLFLRQSEDWLQHLYFAMSGTALAYWAIGEDALLHSTVAITGTYLIMKCMGGSSASVCCSFVFNIGYLILGYKYVNTQDYDYSWTMPHCILCLRMIGLTFDFWDGTKPWGELSDYQKQNSIRGAPPYLLEVLSFGFFPGSYFFGPQFSLQKYRNFMEINRQMLQLPSPLLYGSMRLLLGTGYFCLFLVGKNYLGESYFQPQKFSGRGFFYQTFWLWVWYKTIISSYCGAFLVSEGACIYAGLGYNGVDEKFRQVSWDAVANLNIYLFEIGCDRFQNIIESFNIQTNKWVAEYIYKRLKFLDVKVVSQITTLLFLAVWHGLHPGYYLIFFNEFALLNFVERPMLTLLGDVEEVKRVMAYPGANYVSHALGWLMVNAVMPYAFVPFQLLDPAKFWPVFEAQDFFLYKFIVAHYVLVMGIQLARRFL